MDEIDGIVLRHSQRGMNQLSAHMPQGYCIAAARDALNWRAGRVLIATGFCVSGHPETDGPPGAVMLAHALKALGHEPVIVTDKLCEGLFEAEGLNTEYVKQHDDDDRLGALLYEINPAGMISVERCGRTARGRYLNMRGMDISAFTPPVDRLFELAQARIPTIGIGDGGNEVGMGSVAEHIERELGIEPCAVKTDKLVIATVSNWGAYGICAGLERLSGMRCVDSLEDAGECVRRMAGRGCVDGMSGRPEPRVDGFGMDAEREILGALLTAARRPKV